MMQPPASLVPLKWALRLRVNDKLWIGHLLVRELLAVDATGPLFLRYGCLVPDSNAGDFRPSLVLLCLFLLKGDVDRLVWERATCLRCPRDVP